MSPAWTMMSFKELLIITIEIPRFVYFSVRAGKSMKFRERLQFFVLKGTEIYTNDKVRNCSILM